MIEPRLFPCSGVNLPPDDPRVQGRRVIELDSLGPKANVNLRIHDVARVFLTDLRPRLVDLLEIASYVYAADCSTTRGAHWSDDGLIEPWGRDFAFVFPVRDLAFWRQDKINNCLLRTLSFLTDDQYSFEFVASNTEREVQRYLDLASEAHWPFDQVPRVLLFSGGLDSLAGAVETADKNEPLVLVSHRSKAMLDARQKELARILDERFPGKVLHIPVWVNKGKKLGREHTQRSRSFLYAALAAAVAHSVRADGIRFFENGVVSLNLPVAEEALRARASRTTHPRTLRMFEELFGLVLERPMIVDNPFVLKTRTEIVRELEARGGADLIRHTSSCAQSGFFQSKSQWHCGTCSQCIDRRVAILAAGLEDHDPSTDYVSDVFTGPRVTREEKNIAVDYVQHGVRLHQLGADEILTRFNREISMVVREAEDPSELAEAVVAVHKTHGSEVVRAVSDQLAANLEQSLVGTLDPSCLLSRVQLNEHLVPSWNRYAQRVFGILSEGIPRMCRTKKPENESRLQELCDGLLKGKDAELVREFPFLRWGSVLTKPDWAASKVDLLIELKYVRKKEHVRRVSGEIAEDIVKYGDSGQHVLFVVYDPLHLIVDERDFAAPVEKRKRMLLRFVR